MEKTVRDCLVAALEDLADDELKKFKGKLHELPVREGYDNIPRGRLQKADALDLSDLLVSYYTEGYAVEVAAAALGAVNCKPQAERLRRGTGNGDHRALPGPALSTRSVLGRDAMQEAVPAEQHFIERHREALIQRTGTVEGVLDQLYGTVMDEEQYARICSKGTNQEKMRELYKLVPSWNRYCKDQLYKALKSKNKFLIADLEGQ
ncbi:Apoptosis-associated speck-like protein containing a CARD [Varanus komodoensis]|uniref:Apoptosis-associated speck-like protein containing a CARD n=1 Tax=Varanus komodoensis TaxID=61221 RepID=A0A8D2LQU2_VARKO|nr:apoptosis-associated speck-like protein containing a CARD [Varanus komodoensis]KAF7238774.1 Apoptosis-associated speck-like protein containing a CARD [Varanus komodoensis]